MKGRTWNITSKVDLKTAAAELIDEHGSSAVFALYGDLGAGKTTFTQTIGEILGIDDDITSPTFVIMKRYKTTHDVFRHLIHIDAYRLQSNEELTVLGFEEWLKEDNTLIVIEWADKAEALLPNSAVKLQFTLQNDERTLELLPS